MVGLTQVRDPALIESSPRPASCRATVPITAAPTVPLATENADARTARLLLPRTFGHEGAGPSGRSHFSFLSFDARSRSKSAVAAWATRSVLLLRLAAGRKQKLERRPTEPMT